MDSLNEQKCSTRNNCDASNQTDASNTQNRFDLKEKIGLGGGVALLVGTMVGSGIFVTPTGVLAGTNGSVGLSLILWAVCGIVSGIAALCFCELASMFRESGGSYIYLQRSYGPVGQTLAFTYMWTTLLIGTASSRAGGAIIFGSYALAPFFPGDCQPPFVLVKVSVLLLIIHLNVDKCID